MREELIAAAKRISAALKKLNEGKALSTREESFVHRVIEANGEGRPRADFKLPIYSSMQECAGATDIPLPLLKHAKKHGCLAFRFARVDLRVFLHWMFQESNGGLNGLDSYDWSNELKKWLAKRAKIAHDRDAKLTISIDQAREDINAGTAIYFGRLDKMAIELPAVLRGLGELPIRERLLAEHEIIKKEVRARFTQGL